MYNIKINYTSSNTYNKKGCEEILGPYRNIDVAIENAKKIRKHSDLYYEFNTCFGYGKTRKQAEEHMQKLKDENPEYDEFYVYLQKDDGKEEEIHGSWMGFGERLDEITVCSAELKF